MNFKLQNTIIAKFGTQCDFVDALNKQGHAPTCQSIVSNVVRGRRTLTAEKKKIWAAVLGSSVKELFGGNND